MSQDERAPFPAVASAAQQAATRAQNARNAAANQISTSQYAAGHPLGVPVWGPVNSITRPEPLDGQAELDVLIARLEAAGSVAAASVVVAPDGVATVVLVTAGGVETHHFAPGVVPHLSAS